MPRFHPGDQIEVQFLLGNDPFIVMPSRIVVDRPDRIVHYMAASTTYLVRRQASGEPIPRVVEQSAYEGMETRLFQHAWRAHSLAVTSPGVAHGVRLRFHPETWAFEGWYVNLQRPLARTEYGFQTRDDFLDIQVSPDRAWRWKDEDELALAVERNRLGRAEADAIRTEGERMVARIESAAWPFDRSLDLWRPDPAWRPPLLRDVWKVITE